MDINKKESYKEDLPLIRSTVSFNSFVTLTPFAETTAVQTGDLVYRAYPYLQTSRIAECYMLNSKSSRFRLDEIFGFNLYMSPVAFVCEAKNEERFVPNEKIMELPKPLDIKNSLAKAITRRRSYRQYEGVPISLDKISTILYYSNGYSGEYPIPSVNSEFLEPLNVRARMTASAGGLYPLSIYLIAINIEELKINAYLHLPNDNSVVPVRETLGLQEIYSSFEPARSIIDMKNANFIIVITGNLWKISRKYGNRGLKYMFIESGEIAQNVHLSAQSLKIGTVDIAAYYDLDLEKIVGIDGTSEYIMHTIIGGAI